MKIGFNPSLNKQTNFRALKEYKAECNCSEPMIQKITDAFCNSSQMQLLCKNRDVWVKLYDNTKVGRCYDSYGYVGFDIYTAPIGGEKPEEPRFSYTSEFYTGRNIYKNDALDRLADAVAEETPAQELGVGICGDPEGYSESVVNRMNKLI